MATFIQLTDRHHKKVLVNIDQILMVVDSAPVDYPPLSCTILGAGDSTGIMVREQLPYIADLLRKASKASM